MTINELFTSSVNEIERILSTKTVVGEPITVDGHTLIPLLSIGFGFGVGEGTGANQGATEGSGGGLGGGGGVRPVALVVIDEAGVRVEPVAPKSSAMERIATTLADRSRTSGKKGSELGAGSQPSGAPVEPR